MKYDPKKRLDKPHPFAPVRYPRTLWFYIHWFLAFLTAPIRLPIQVFFAFFFIGLATFLVKLLIGNVDVKKPLHPIRLRLIQVATCVCARISLFFQGFVYIREVNPHLKPKPTQTSVVVSNHIASMDPFVMLTVGLTSFVAKDEVRKMPAYGLLAFANQAIFNKRESAAGRARAAQEMKERIDPALLQAGLPRPFPPLTVCPEGTTTNNVGILAFRRGAFMGGGPVSVIDIEYPHTHDHSDASQHMAKPALFGLLPLPFRVVTITYHGDFIPSADEAADPVLAAASAREFLMRRAGRFIDTPYTYQDKLYFYGKSDDFSKCSDLYKRDFFEGCQRKNGYWIDYTQMMKIASKQFKTE